MSKITDLTASLAAPLVSSLGLSLWDVEYVKEAGSFYLRVYIDKPGGIAIDDCEAVSRALSDLLDEADPISEAYIFEVSSPGADRILRTPQHFAQYLGQAVDLRFYKARDGAKSLTGTLAAYQDGNVTLTVAGESLEIPKQDVAQVRLHVSF